MDSANGFAYSNIVSINKKRRYFGSRSGQVMLEYVMVVGMLLALVSVMALLLYTFKENGGRVLDLIASDAP